MKKLILSETHERIGGKMIDFSGYYMPVQYSEGIKIEHKTVRESVGVFDVSHMGEIFISGEKSLDFLQYITTNDVSRLKPGKVQYTCFPNNSGGIVDDLLLYMLEKNKYLLVVNASNIEKDIAWINKYNTFECIIENQSENYSLLAIQGPKSIDLLQELTDINLSEIQYYTFRIATVSDIENVILSRTGYTGEIGFEIYIKNKHTLALWDSLFNTSIEIKPIGLAARDTLRLEKGFCLYGNEINESTSPIQAGLGWITKFTKKFINYKCLKHEKETGVDKTLVGLELIEKGIARSGYLIFSNEGLQIGVITSGTMSPTLEKAIAMGYLLKEFSNPGNEVVIQIRNKNVKAKVCLLPFVK